MTPDTIRIIGNFIVTRWVESFSAVRRWGTIRTNSQKTVYCERFNTELMEQIREVRTK
jgi:hypothetical protein